MSRTNKFIFLFCLLALAVFGRLLPHIWNATPILALSLFVSAYFGFEYSIFFVFAAMFVSDSIIGFYSWQIMISVYGSLFLAGFLGQYIKRHKNVGAIAVVTFSSSILFFLVTNFAVWQFGSMYSHTWQGLMDCYTMAIPIFRNTLVGDLFYTSVFFGAYEFALYMITKHRAISSLATENI